ncbi:Pre-B-cell leukemia transcription factor-interacting protein 1 Hematopoietic PBX-interacting protein [Collichthys lucidus]|uniref:Pre-B-cell leukemia transcription factor-interacting protein 1 Hematopoietic PBX-interacting protein n=1 Tax=Collichthys lucidus TaxID=240159 RepID=A0A4U5VJ21_COLLU|nr:Pre-B-cell leukemia transcription factor-interacting protein 1 Hematopoietic PBX-interacting protein [Collichthys lucidus]
MSDNSNSTGSTGSSTNSWTLLSPEEAAVENVGPVDDGTESLGDVPSLSEEVAGAVDFKSDISVETVLSEEGHQVCQETSPESSEGPIPSSPTRLSPLPLSPLDPPDLDMESQPPVIHDIVTSSPSDNEHLGATPFVTNIAMGAPLDIPTAELLQAEPEESCSDPLLTEIPVSTEQVLETPADIEPLPAGLAVESPVFTAEPEVSIPAETLTATHPLSHDEADISFTPEGKEPPSQDTENLVTESPIDDSPAPETVGSEEAEEEAAEEREEREEIGEEGGEGEEEDEEDEEEEVEFKLAEKKEEKPWFSLNKCILGALILLFLGSLFLSGDFDASELTDGEQSQDWLSSDPQDMKELLDKLTQENQQIAQLEAQLQSQKEELDAALKAVAVSGDEQSKAGLEQENAKLKEELSTLPELKKELESLRSRVTELSQLTADEKMAPATSSSAPQPADKDESTQKAAGPERRNEGGRVKEELQRQKVLLEESRKRLEGMKKDGGDRKRVRDSLEAIQRKLSQQVERWSKKKPQEPKWKGNKGKTNERDHWKKDEKEWRGEKDWKHSKEGGRKDKEKDKEWKSQKQNSHKEAWRKHQDEWERKKGERKTDRDERRKEKPWHSQPGKNSHNQQQHQHHHHHQQPRQPQQHNQNDFWRDQEQKLRRNVHPQQGCSSVEDCAGKEGLYPVELPEFEELLEGYLSKLEGSSSESKDKIRKLTAEFFEGGVFIHDRVLFSDFAEDVADILEDMVDVLDDGGQKDDDSLEEEMEEFEREALWKFAATA